MQPTGVAVLDQAIGGLVPGLPLVIAGGPGSGRTVLCLELARRALASALVQQADSLGINLISPGWKEQFILLQLSESVAGLVRQFGC